MRILPVLLMAVLLYSCSNDKTSLAKEIESLTLEMQQEEFPSSENMDKIVVLYDQFIQSYPDDPKSFTYYEMKAKYLAANNKYAESLSTYDEIIEKYPTDTRTADAIFMQAFIYENHLDDKENAEKKYQLFIDSYPTHDLVDDAQFSLDNLSLTDEQLFEKLLKMQEE